MRPQVCEIAMLPPRPATETPFFARPWRFLVDPNYRERYRELYEKHWWWRARTEFIVDTVRRYRPPGGWRTILDIGCGDGLFFDRLLQFGEVEGVEAFAELINPANPYRDRIFVGAFDEGFVPTKQYSLILMLDVLEHLQSPAAALRHALQLLEGEGTFIATVPAFMLLWTNHDVLNHHMTRYTKRSFHCLAQSAGLNICEQRYFYHWTCPVKLGVGFLERVFRLAPAPPKVPARVVNEALFLLSRFEQKTFSTWPLPFGSSLLVVGGKAGSHVA
jgi:SAM-dependent methyltransferase